MLNSGGAPFHEQDIEPLLEAPTSSGALTFHPDNTIAVDGARVIVIALPTPSAPDGSADLSYIEGALRDFSDALLPRALVVMKSTVPVGSTARFQSLLDDLDADVTVVSNPEFLRESSSVSDFFHPDRIVIGTTNEEAASAPAEMYREIDAPVVVTDPASSEMIKYASNAYLATRLTFASTLANLCEYVGADVIAVLEGVGYDHRIGSHFLKPGPGHGGSCFLKDTLALVSIADDAGYDFALMRGVIEANHAQMERTVSKITTAIDGIDHPRAGLRGLAFKAGTDDTRHSPAVKIAVELVSAGVEVTTYDPAVALAPVAGVTTVGSALAAAEGADVLVVALNVLNSRRSIWPTCMGPCEIRRSSIHATFSKPMRLDDWECPTRASGGRRFPTSA